MINERQSTIRKIFPNGTPRLLCPPLTHFVARMQPDAARIEAQYRFMSCHVKGFLIPGSTGDGWLMNDEQVMQVLLLQCKNAVQYGGRILAGVLKPEEQEMLDGIAALKRMVKQHTGQDDTEGFLQMGICGITVCAPKGAQRTQEEIYLALSHVLEVGLPTALYQLPQITGNEIAPQTLSMLAKKYENFFLFKDTSGADRVALSGVDMDGVILVRGAEGDYATWYKGMGGKYDGFLLSTANAFAPELSQILSMIDNGDHEVALSLSQRLSNLIHELFVLVGDIKQSNVFANANRIADHFNAYGDLWDSVRMPMLPDGSFISKHIVTKGHEIMEKTFPDRLFSYM